MLPLLIGGAAIGLAGTAMQKAPTQVNWQNVNAARGDDFWNSGRYAGLSQRSDSLQARAADYGLGGRAEDELLGRQEEQFKRFSGLSTMKSSGLLGEALGSMQRQLASQGISGTASNALMRNQRNDLTKKVGEQNYMQDSEFLLKQGQDTERGLQGLYGIGAQYQGMSGDLLKSYYGLTQNEMLTGMQEQNRVNIANSQGKFQADQYNAGVNDSYNNRWSGAMKDLGGGLLGIGGNIAGKGLAKGNYNWWSGGQG